MEHLLDHFVLHPIFHLEIAGLDLSINMAVISMWVSSLLAFLIIYAASRKVSLVPNGRLLNFVETIVEFAYSNFIEENIGPEGRKWFPFLFSLFMFIWFANLIGLVPGFFTPTSSVFVTATLAFLIVFPSVHIYGIIKHGFIKYMKSFVPHGVPAAIAPFLFVIEIISAFAKPFSLTVRLFANMFAGHLVLLTFIALILEFKSFIIAPMPMLGGILVMGLEILFTAIQAYIFTTLSSMYIADAMHGGH
ncbi:MAG: F0F1 ATP synthase subunit A [Actinobacteria bacterium]|nr:F0F1 ATP synthase subunit A [Actinomycetota bacterium]